jgi:hypothetical protein
VLILVDELQANSTGIKELVAAYQELIGERANIAMVLAGLPQAVSATLNDKVLTFLNRANKQTLEPLAAAEVDTFFRNAFSKLDIIIADDDIALAVEKTYGSPYMMQLVGHNIVLNAEGGCAITTPTVKRAIEYAQTGFENDICQTTLAALSDKDVDFLRAMSQDDTSSNIGDIAKRMGVSPDYAQKYRKRLLEAGVIKTPRRGQVQFDVPYLKERLKALI